MSAYDPIEPTAITAVLAGRKADGSPLTRRYSYVMVREPEHEFSRPETSRIWHRVWIPQLGRYDTHCAVVLTDSIEAEVA